MTQELKDYFKRYNFFLNTAKTLYRIYLPGGFVTWNTETDELTEHDEETDPFFPSKIQTLEDITHRMMVD